MATETKTAQRRPLQFQTIDDALADVDQIVAADRAGTLRRGGSWTTGQTLGHLAAWINYGYEGYPAEMRPPWFVKAIARMMKNSFLHKPMRPGFRMPKIEAGTFATQDMSTEEGARRLREAMERLKRREEEKFPSPALGPLTVDERTALNLRHAELHLSFLWP